MDALRSRLIGGGVELEKDEVCAVDDADREGAVRSPMHAAGESRRQAESPLIGDRRVEPVRSEIQVAGYRIDRLEERSRERVGRSDRSARTRRGGQYVHIPGRPIDQAEQVDGGSSQHDDGAWRVRVSEPFADRRQGSFDGCATGERRW